MEKEQMKSPAKPTGVLERLGLRSSPTWSFSKRGPLPARIKKGPASAKSQKRYWIFIFLIGLTGLAAWYLIRSEQPGPDAEFGRTGFMPLDEDYRAASNGGLCVLPSVRYQDLDSARLARPDSSRPLPNPAAQSVKAVTEHAQVNRKRPAIELEHLVYFEKMTRNRVRVLFENGSCRIYTYRDLLYNIQEQRSCDHFQPVPRDGVATEYINIHFIKSFEKVRCDAGEWYRARIAMDAGVAPQCATFRVLRDQGVGLFSVYVYRKLRHLMEALDPRADYRYRQVVEC